MAVFPRAPGVTLRAQLHACDVTQHDPRTVGGRPQHDGGELFRRGQLAIGTQRHGNALAGDARRIADAAWRDLQVLLLDGRGHIAHGQAIAGQPGRVQPYPHGLLGTEQLHAADAIDAAQLFDDVARHEVTQRRLADTGIRRAQADQHQEAGIGRFHEQAVLAHAARQAGFDRLDPVLHIHLRQLRVGPRLEGGGDRGFAGARARSGRPRHRSASAGWPPGSWHRC
ncbi:hypothetical protein G6F31_012776 [Rhizopus arrhizus]|nr:hypothetical protein G6F31_012776 [Rhizopus arrhizus]